MYAIPETSEFYPFAHVIFHNKKKLESFFKMTEETRVYKSKIQDNIKFDFENYSYIIVYGRTVKKMWYSYKETLFDDPSPSYNRSWKKQVVFVEYNDKNSGQVYIYQIPKDDKLRLIEME